MSNSQTPRWRATISERDDDEEMVSPEDFHQQPQASTSSGNPPRLSVTEVPIEKYGTTVVTIKDEGDADLGSDDETDGYRSKSWRGPTPRKLAEIASKELDAMKHATDIREIIREETRREKAERRTKNRFRLFINDITRKIRNSATVRTLKRYIPLQNAVWAVERSFGTGIGMFYEFYIRIIYINLYLFIIAMSLAVIPFVIDPYAAVSTAELFPYLNITNPETVHLNGTDYWQILASIDTAIGVFGFSDKTLRHSWYYYGGYPLSSPANNFSFFVSYPIMVMLYLLLSLIVIIMAISAKVGRSDASEIKLPYSQIVLGIWDHSVSDATAVKELAKAMSSSLKEQLRHDELKEKKMSKRTKLETLQLVLRRVIGIGIFIILLVGAIAGVFLIVTYSEVIKNPFGDDPSVPDFIKTVFTYSQSVLLTTISVGFPIIVRLAVTFEKYEDSATTIYNCVFRIYAIKIVLVISVLYNMMNNQQTTGCVPTATGLLLYQMMVIDFVTSLVSEIVVPTLNRSIKRRKLEFDVPSNVIQLLYRQTFIWIGTMFSPMIPVIGILSNFTLFYVKYYMMKLTCKFPEKPVASASNSTFFLNFLMLTLGLNSLAIYYFLTSVNEGGEPCGPHVDPITKERFAPLASVEQYLNDPSIPQIIARIINAFTRTSVLLSIIVILIALLTLSRARGNRIQKRLDRALDSVAEERAEKLTMLRAAGVTI